MPDGVRDEVIRRLITFFEGKGRNSCFSDVLPRLAEMALTSDLHSSFKNPCVLGVMRQSLSNAMLGAFFCPDMLTDSISDRIGRQIVDICYNMILGAEMSELAIDPFMPAMDPAFFVDIHGFVMRGLRPVVDMYRKVFFL
jgi:hypothetical protein